MHNIKKYDHEGETYFLIFIFYSPKAGVSVNGQYIKYVHTWHSHACECDTSWDQSMDVCINASGYRLCTHMRGHTRNTHTHSHSHIWLVSPTVVSSLTVRQGSSLHLLITISNWRVKWRSVLCLTFDPMLFMWRTSNPVWAWLGWALMRPHVCPLWAVRFGCPAFIPDHLPLM